MAALGKHTSRRVERRAGVRNQTFGFIFQFYHLLPELTALENVLVPQMISHSVLSWFGQRRELKRQASEMLDRVGLGQRAHHKHSQYLLAASQIFGLSNEETAIVSNIARYHRRGMPQQSHLPYVALDRDDRLIVNKLAAILRLANALDAEHLQKVRDLRLLRRDRAWILEIEGAGDLTMEQLAATARADMFVETFGRELIVRPAGVPS